MTSTEREWKLMAAASSNPTVTVVMIFLNAETYIEEAIESVLAQTFGDWELVLVDDGSTDRSTAIAKRYAERQSRKDPLCGASGATRTKE